MKRPNNGRRIKLGKSNAMGRPRKPIPDPRPTPGEMVQDIRDAIRATMKSLAEVFVRTDALVTRMMQDQQERRERE
jgi:hypothetical protein